MQIPFFTKKIKNSTAALLLCIFGLACLLALWNQATYPTGGQDSWNHYLYARFATQHPHLMMDQWAKTLYTIPAIPFAQLGIQGVIGFNIFLVVVTGYMCYLCARRLGMRHPWLAVALYIFHPIVFNNTVSGLTEPLNALVLAIIFYLLITHRDYSGAILASFLPYFRSEGYVLLIAFILYFIAYRKWKYLPYLFTGIIVFMILGKVIYGDLFWVFKANPYVVQEIKGTFRPSGALFHYIKNSKGIWGLPITALVVGAIVLLLGYTINLFKKHTDDFKMGFLYWLVLPLFLGFLLVHSVIYWMGSMGSHGLHRVFMVVAPATCLLSILVIDKIISFDIRFVNKGLPIILFGLLFYSVYKSTDLPYPWKKTNQVAGYQLYLGHQNVEKALAYLDSQKIKPTQYVHQLPYLNALYNWDPFISEGKEKQTEYIWSIPKTEDITDYVRSGAVVIFDNYHAVRDATMPLQTMMHKENYTFLKKFSNAHENTSDTFNDIYLFIKK